MMVLFRIVFGLALLAGLASFALYAYTGERFWRQRGVVIVKWTLIAAIGFFAVLIVQNLFFYDAPAPTY